MKRVPFQQVDVFTRVPFMGNPVAVVLDGAGLSTTQMQAIANWTNLSETTFITQPTDSAADYCLRSDPGYLLRHYTDIDGFAPQIAVLVDADSVCQAIE